MPTPTQATIVIIGGGIMGCSLAYHLCHEGQTDVLLLEKGELTSGSTWHAAGQITHSVSHYALAKIAAYGTDLYPRLEQETGQSCSWHGCGSLRVAYQEAEVDWLRYTLSVGKGLAPMEIIHPQRIAELHPFYRLHGIRAALHTPEDGHVDPAGVTLALAKGARQLGATILRHNRACGITVQPNGEYIVHTQNGDITAHTVVNAGGTYARQIAQWVGLDLPMANLLHHYLITDRVPEFAELEPELPVVRDDHRVSGYIRMEQRCGLIGIYEKANPTTVWDDATPWEAENELFAADYEAILPWLNNALERMPILAKLGIKRAVRGAITQPPDGNMLLGPTALRNFWLCCGAQVGIAWGPGAGKYLAQWMVHGAADISLRSFDPRRFGAHLDDQYRIAKGKEDYLLRHEIPYPARDRPSCRPSHSKTSPLYEILARKGAVYEDVFGWERPLWYAPTEGAHGTTPQEHILSFRRSPLHAITGQAVAQLRRHAGIADLTAFAKMEVWGADVVAYLQRVSSNTLPQKIGSISLTYLVLANGRIEGEATLLKLGDERFYLVYAAVREMALLQWLEQQRQPRERVHFDNVSENYGVLMLAGPKSRDILGACTDTPLDNAHFRWLTARTITIAGVPQVRALRVTYTGELGWELHIPLEPKGLSAGASAAGPSATRAESAMAVIYHALTATRHSDQLAHIGSAALNAMRMEKGYLSGHELTNEVTLAEAGRLRFAGGTQFQGRAASIAPPHRWQLARLKLDEPPKSHPQADPSGAESVWFQGRVVGQISSGGYGYSVGHYLAWAYLPPDLTGAGTELEVLVLGIPRHAVVIPPP